MPWSSDQTGHKIKGPLGLEQYRYFASYHIVRLTDLSQAVRCLCIKLSAGAGVHSGSRISQVGHLPQGVGGGPIWSNSGRSGNLVDPEKWEPCMNKSSKGAKPGNSGSVVCVCTVSGG